MDMLRLDIYPDAELLSRLDEWIVRNTPPGSRVPSRAQAAREILVERFDRDDKKAAKAEKKGARG